MFPARTLLILATTSTGFGHLRVTQALQAALPKAQPVHLLGVRDHSVRLLYGLVSRNPLLRAISEFIQNHRLVEDLYNHLFRRYLSYSASSVYQLFVQLLRAQTTPPDTLIVVATHFSLAHQIAFCKSRIEKKFHLRLVLAVVVTDDSPQHIWSIPGADYIFVPSLTTKTRLDAYLGRFPPPLPQIIVTPYPLSPSLSTRLSPAQISLRRLQLDPVLSHPINIIVPISGAAVQLSYIKDLLGVLVTDPRMNITVVSRVSSYTSAFLDWCQKYSQIQVLSSPDDEQVVKLYEQAYSDQLYSLEITKPSEQAFKALLPPTVRGGSLLLFSPPVGRQEVDNLNFLRRHQLLSSDFSGRALLLPGNGHQAGEVICSWLRSGQLLHMLNFSAYLPHPELRPDGTRIFWSKLHSLVY